MDYTEQLKRLEEIEKALKDLPCDTEDVQKYVDRWIGEIFEALNKKIVEY